MRAYTAEINAQRDGDRSASARLHSERQTIVRKLEGLYDAIADGLRTPGLKVKLDELEAKLAALDAQLAAPAPSPLRLHPNLSELYRQKVDALANTLSDPQIRTPALEVMRGLIEHVTVHHGSEGVTLELEGALTAMIGFAQNDKSPLGSGLDVGAVDCSTKVVAGTRHALCLPIFTGSISLQTQSSS